MMLPVLNWKEIAALVESIRPEVSGLFVDRVVIPERPRFPDGFLRGEWVLRLTGRRSEYALFFGIRARNPYLALGAGKGPKAASGATQSPFILAIGKALKGARILDIQALPRERIVVLWLTAEGSRPEQEKLGLVHCLIPAMPETLFVRWNAATPDHWRIIARSRTLSPEKARATSPDFAVPQGSQAPIDPPFRAELISGGPSTFYKVLEKSLADEAFELRLRAAERELKERVKGAKERLRQSGQALSESQKEPDWQRFGELLKSVMYQSPPPVLRGDQSYREAPDFETGEPVLIPADPQLDLPAQVEKFFQLARRKARRAEEARTRISGFVENIAKWESALTQPPETGNWANLEKLERQASIVPQNRAQAAARSSGGGGKGKISSWLGKTFISKDGLLILAGRSKDENLELTFKHARGNDLWLHVRGRPGAHVIIPLQPGKSAPLETLLDAATLAIYYSGGEKWGKTEVDYAFKKYVRRIKDSSEASYTNNKTLIVEPEPARIKRLLASQDNS